MCKQCFDIIHYCFYTKRWLHSCVSGSGFRFRFRFRFSIFVSDSIFVLRLRRWETKTTVIIVVVIIFVVVVVVVVVFVVLVFVVVLVVVVVVRRRRCCQRTTVTVDKCRTIPTDRNRRRRTRRRLEPKTVPRGTVPFGSSGTVIAGTSKRTVPRQDTNTPFPTMTSFGRNLSWFSNASREPRLPLYSRNDQDLMPFSTPKFVSFFLGTFYQIERISSLSVDPTKNSL